MANSSLTLIPFGKQSFTVGLLENDGHRGSVERIIEQSATTDGVFSDLTYEFVLNYEDIAAVKDVRFYVNDTYESTTFADGRISFPTIGAGFKRIFLDCYGFVELSLTLIFEDGTEQNLISNYLPVLVHRGQLNEAVQSMVKYVYDHQESLFLNGEPKPRNIAGLKESNYRNLASQIILAEEIATIYENSYGYFKANSRFCIEKAAIVDRLERVQYVTPATLEYTVSHPEQLRPVNSNAGVRIGKRVYQPQRTLSLQNVELYDIYENRVIVGFLRKMVDEINELCNRCKTLLTQIPSEEDYSPEYIYSSFYMFSETRKSLEDGLQQLSSLYEKYIQLWGMYSNALAVSSEKLAGKPRPTAIFMSVPQYNKIFVRIYQWFSFGIYNFSKENFMLSFIKISSLYESYLLAKMISYFQDRGYTLNHSSRCIYPATSPKWKYRNTTCQNTFSFSDEKKNITLYYQPVIYDADRSNINGIGLYRNNSIPIFTSDNDDRSGGKYYTPDYLLELDNSGCKRYVLIDAKFSDIRTVRNHHVKDLAFKYLFSISPVNKETSVAGMCILYGKCNENETTQSAYDKEILGHPIMPFADLIPLIEGVADNDQYNKLDLLLRKLFA